MSFLSWLFGSQTPSGGRCTVCQGSLPMRYLIGPEGQAFCPTHELADSFCTACSTPIPPPFQGKSYCRDCQHTEVASQAEARALLSQVQRELRDLGLPWWPQEVPVDFQEMQGHQVGLCRTRILIEAGRRRVELVGISVQPRMPQLLLGKVLAHELGHAFLTQQGLENLPPLVSEGFCELCGWLWLGRQRDPKAPRLRTLMENNQTPVYGEGFRMIKASLGPQGIAGVVKRLKASHAGAALPIPVC